MPRPRRHTHLRWLTEISVTPLLDLVFILLFAFMVALPVVSRSDALFPSASKVANPAAAPDTPPETAILNLNRGGSLLWQGQPMDWPAIPALIATALKRQPELGVLVIVPPDQTVSNLAKVMSLLATTGVRHTAIEVAESKL